MPMTVAEMLREAEDAYHQLQIGKSAVEIRDGTTGESVRYSQANVSALERYIASLRDKLTPPTSGSRAPLRFFYS